MGIQYLRLVHSGLSEKAEELREDLGSKWQPMNIGHQFVKNMIRKNNGRSTVMFELRLDRVYEAIITAQLTSRGYNGFREALTREIKKAQDRPMSFRMFGTEKDRVWTLGYGFGRVNSGVTEGRNLYGQVLTKVTEQYRNGVINAEENTALIEKMLTIDSFQCKFQKSLLVVADSQARHLEWVSQGDVVSVGGAKYRDLANVLRTEQYNPARYAKLFLYCGTCCSVTSKYTSQQRDAELYELKWDLEQLMVTRPVNSIFFCCAFNTPDNSEADRAHAAHVCQLFEGIGVSCLRWDNFPNAFLDSDGYRDQSLFARDRLHFNPDGLHYLWKYCCDMFPKMQIVSYQVSERTSSRDKRDFEALAEQNPCFGQYNGARVPRGPPKSPLVDPKAKEDYVAQWDRPQCSYHRDGGESPRRFRGKHRSERSRSPRRHHNDRSVVYRSRSPTRPKDRSSPHSGKGTNGHRKPITSPLRSPSHSPRVSKRAPRQESPSDSSSSDSSSSDSETSESESEKKEKISRKRGKKSESKEKGEKSSQKRGNKSRKWKR